MIETRAPLTLSPDLAMALLAADSDVVVIADERGRVQWVSPSVEQVLGWVPERFVHVGAHLLHPADQCEAAAAFDLVRSRPGAHHVGEVRHLAVDGSWRPLEVTAINLLDAHGVVVTRYRDLGSRASHDADPVVLDEVTGLPSRSSVHRSLAERIFHAHDCVAVLFLDLDGFKEVNDRHGHACGDAVLAEVARRLGTRLRDSELLARWGGDEFVAVVDVPGPALAINVAARLHTAIAEEPFEIDGRGLDLGVSVGVAIGGADADAESLIHAADRAMYEAKRSGGGIATAGTIAA